MSTTIGLPVFGFSAFQIVRDAGVDDPVALLEMVFVGASWHFHASVNGCLCCLI